jgi:hypothetical protein
MRTPTYDEVRAAQRAAEKGLTMSACGEHTFRVGPPGSVGLDTRFELTGYVLRDDFGCEHLIMPIDEDESPGDAIRRLIIWLDEEGT